MKIITSQKLSSFPNLVHGSSTKSCGPLNFYLDKDRKKVLSNREAFARKLGFKIENLVNCFQTHGDRVKIVTEKDKGRGAKDPISALQNCDAIVTDKPDVILSILTADCVCIFLYDPKQKVVALAHAGWLGTSREIGVKTVSAMQEHFHSSPRDLIAYLGPSIEGCCYNNEHHPERLKLFQKKWPAAVLEKKYIDIKLANKTQLEKIGVREIETSPHCTYCENEILPSHRRQGKKRKISIMNVIGMKS
ncbi:MAG: peptidoglycan editing factor PgeF [Patescibacteria group bacterium]|nr:peptidoglycan editing factor PgeF [Patescibacteria group bacterium]